MPVAIELRSEAGAMRPAIEKIITSHKFRLDPPVRERLVDDIVDAVGFAKAGLADILAGKQARSVAWTLDIFVRDVCDALRKAGIAFSMNPCQQYSRVQSLAAEIIQIAGLIGHGRKAGNLFKQMQRARRIEKRRWPDISVRWPLMFLSGESSRLWNRS